MDDWQKKLIFFYFFVTGCISIMYLGIESSGQWRGPFWGTISFVAHALWYLPIILCVVVLLVNLLPLIWQLGTLPLVRRREKIEKLHALIKKREEKNIVRRLELKKASELIIIKQQEEDKKRNDLKIKNEILELKKLRDATKVSQDALKEFL